MRISDMAESPKLNSLEATMQEIARRSFSYIDT